MADQGTSPQKADTSSKINTHVVFEIPSEPIPHDGHVEADYDNSDTRTVYDHYETKSVTSSNASISSALYKGYIENGRRYQSLRENKYFGVSDDKQFESMEAGHLVYMILDCHSPNPLFRSPIIANPKNILDIGTGDGNWAMDVAERYPMATVQGVDLYPPPHTWAPDNCFLEVDDISKEWAFSAKFDLIHIRHLHAAFTLEGWDQLYKRAYDNLQPGGWVEHAELDVAVHCDDTSLPKDALLRGWGPMFKECAARSGQPIDNETSMRARIEAAGFININEKSHILPIGPWARHPVYKDAGRVNHAQWMSGAEGWAMWLLTKHGSPEPWPVEKVGDYIEKIKGELARGYHIYQKSRRVWAQKPLDDRHRPLTAEEEREHEEEMEERRAKRLRSC